MKIKTHDEYCMKRKDCVYNKYGQLNCDACRGTYKAGQQSILEVAMPIIGGVYKGGKELFSQDKAFGKEFLKIVEIKNQLDNTGREL